MRTIIVQELKNAIISFKSIFIILFFGLISHLIAQNFHSISSVLKDISPISVVYSLIETFGVFFGFLLFSGSIAKIVENESIRYITPYLSRTKLLFSKYLAMVIYFAALLLIMVPIVIYDTKQIYFPWEELAEAIIFFVYISSIILFLSVISKKERKATFTGVFLGIIIPIVGILTSTSKNIILEIVSWSLPYRYTNFNLEYLVLVILSALFLTVTIVIFDRMEL